MKLLIFSIGPIFPNMVHGGSQKVLVDIARGLGKRGWTVDILSPPRDHAAEPFSLAQNVTVYPDIPLRGTFPTPYGVPPHCLTQVYQALEKRMPHYDVFYVHDGSLLIENIKNKIPTVISLRDLYYQETLLGAINFRESYLIVNSLYTYLCLRDSFGTINPSILPRTQLIYNGYDSRQICRKADCSEVLSLLGLQKGDEQRYKLIGFPHRPDLDKGFLEALELLSRLIRKDQTIRLLIPNYMDAGISSRADSTYRLLQDQLENLHLEDYVVFHPWVPHPLMCQYYSICRMVLCIGSFVESFSNVSAEALLCGTPVLATNAATYRTMPIRDHIFIAEHSNLEQMETISAAILESDENKYADYGRRAVLEKLDEKTMTDQFERVFIAAANGDKLQPFSYKDNPPGTYRLTSWCVPLSTGIYNDYAQTLVSPSLDGRLFVEQPYWTAEALVRRGVSEEVIRLAVNEGTLFYQKPTTPEENGNTKQRVN